MQILSSNELFDINGGRSLMITPYYGFIKAIKWIFKFIRARL